MNKTFRICLISILIITICSGCKTASTYLVSSYINELAIRSGIGDSEDCNDNFVKLYNWGIVEENDIQKLKEPLNYDYLCKTIGRLIEQENNYLVSIQNMGWVDVNVNPNSYVDENKAISVIDSAIYFINNKRVESIYEYKLKDNVKENDDEVKEGDIVYKENLDAYVKVTNVSESGYQYESCNSEDIYEYLNIADSFEINFEEAEVIPYEEEIRLSNYVNTSYNLLSSKKNHVFNTEGFKVSYTLSKNGISVHVSRDVNDINVYADLSLSNVKPTFQYTQEDEDLKNCYFKVSYNATEKLGASIGKYKNYTVDFSNLKSGNFLKQLGSKIHKEDDEIEATLKICEVKTPIPNVPTAYFNMDVLLKLYVSGKAELVCYGDHTIGFETKNGELRTIFENERDFDGVISSSAKAAAAINFNLETLQFKLMDVELDGGIKSEVKTTLHLYDEEGNDTVNDCAIAYSTMEELTEGSDEVKVCGDLSLYWLFDLYINTSKTKMNKMGFSKKISLLDEDDEVFGNLHHIENGVFVKSCTRKNRNIYKTSTINKTSSNHIVLDSYAEVLSVNETYSIIVTSLPDGYSSSDLVYESENVSIANTNGKLVSAIRPGVTKIIVSTSDGMYQAVVNILVSNG